MDVLVHYRHDLGKIGGLEKRISTNSNRLQIRYASYSANQWLSPMVETPSNEGVFLVSATPLIERAPGVGYFKGRGIGSRSVKVLVFGRRLLLRELCLTAATEFGLQHYIQAMDFR